VHGPTPRSYEQRTPKKMKATALRGALSDRARGGRVHVISSLVDGEVPSTKAAVAALASVTDSRNVLVVVERSDMTAWKSLRNVEHVHVIVADQLNTYDVLVCDDVVFTEAALQAFLAARGVEMRVPAVARESAAAAAEPDSEPDSADDSEPDSADDSGPDSPEDSAEDSREDEQ
jgi:large subunit ribosomal protein L4